MGFRTDSYAKVWEVKTKAEKYTDAKISISKKNKHTDQYETDFSAIVRFIGEAHKKASELTQGSKIKVLSCDTTNKYDKEKQTTYWRCIVFDFEFTEDSVKATANSAPAPSGDMGFMSIPDGIDDSDGLPFA